MDAKTMPIRNAITKKRLRTQTMNEIRDYLWSDPIKASKGREHCREIQKKAIVAIAAIPGLRQSIGSLAGKQHGAALVRNGKFAAVLLNGYIEPKTKCLIVVGASKFSRQFHKNRLIRPFDYRFSAPCVTCEKRHELNFDWVAAQNAEQESTNIAWYRELTVADFKYKKG